MLFSRPRASRRRSLSLRHSTLAVALPLLLAAGPAVPGPQHETGTVTKHPAADQSPAQELETLPGFKLELLLKADPKLNGSWINMAKDPQGRLWLGGQKGQPIT